MKVKGVSEPMIDILECFNTAYTYSHCAMHPFNKNRGGIKEEIERVGG